jgi:hypothetical protein
VEFGLLGPLWEGGPPTGARGALHQAAGDPDKARTAWEDALALLDELHHPDAEPRPRQAQ